MSELPDRARVVIVGGGITGNAVAYHLARQGWTDLVLVDQGPFPNPGGSTGHSSAMVWLPESTRPTSLVTADSIRQYVELGAFRQSGGIEVARTPERLEDFKRRLALIAWWGFEAHLLSPAEVKALVPYIEERLILGGLYTPRTGVADPVRAGTLLRERAQEIGALQAFALTEVLGIDVAEGRVVAVRTDRGTVETDAVVVCCGVWSPRLARMAGTTIPMVPSVSQLVSIGPVRMFSELPGEISFPILRDSDRKIYARPLGADLEVGSHALAPILVEPDDIPSLAGSALSPTELPLTGQDFDDAAEYALELMPSILGDERAGMRYAINGLISLSADGLPIVGEAPDIRGFWSANRVDIKVAPAVARTLAEWMTHGKQGIYGHPWDIARFLDHERTAAHVRARSAEWFVRNYETAHPGAPRTSSRNARLSPMHVREQELDAVFMEIGGWEVPAWYGSNERLLDELGARVMPRTVEWDARWWSPIIHAEHLAMRDRVAIGDASSLGAFEIIGRGALGALDRLAVSSLDVPLGAVVQTFLLDPAGMAVSDVTVFRLARDRFRLITDPRRKARDTSWLERHLPDDGSVTLVDVSSAWCAVRVWGPRAADVVRAAGSRADADELITGTLHELEIANVPVLARRHRFVGEPAWEIHAPMEQGLRLWDALREAGAPHGILPVGSAASGTTGRIEVSERALDAELIRDFTLAEAGIRLPEPGKADFIGKAAAAEQSRRAPDAVLCTLSVDDHRSPSREHRYMLGQEPILTREGHPLVDARGRRSWVTSAASGPSVGRHLLMAYLPVAEAVVGAQLSVEYFGDLYPVTVAVAGEDPLYSREPDRSASRAREQVTRDPTSAAPPGASLD